VGSSAERQHNQEIISEKLVDRIKSDALNLVSQQVELKDLEALKTKLLGKKGSITGLMKGLKDVDPSERKKLGALLNQAKVEVEASLNVKIQDIKEELELGQLEKEWIDVSLPVDAPILSHLAGSIHPLTAVQRELEQIFVGLGFDVVDGPEVESEYYNFDALNIPEEHPARDMQDTFWLANGSLLRTQTSAIQVRALEQREPPLRIVAPGRCFRYEKLDATHEHTFYQMEGMMIDREVTVAHLIYFMKTLLREVFGCEQKIRLRPGYFPFVEPGFELDIWFNGKWMELLPCGLVHPKVLEAGGIDSSQWQGFAFGLGLSRLVMSRYQIDDIRHLQGCDLRFMRQFP
jgi:phenylalanyl-tRNA synthetase alpha chain